VKFHHSRVPWDGMGLFWHMGMGKPGWGDWGIYLRVAGHYFHVYHTETWFWRRVRIKFTSLIGVGYWRTI
jgi:hypothetical protein